MKLDGPTTELLLQYINNENVQEMHRQLAAIQLKNTIKKVFGGHSYTHYDEKKQQQDNGELLPQDDPANLMDDQGRQILQAKLVDLMLLANNQGKKTLTNVYLEIIALMGRKYVQHEWP